MKRPLIAFAALAASMSACCVPETTGVSINPSAMPKKAARGFVRVIISHSGIVWIELTVRLLPPRRLSRLENEGITFLRLNG